MSLLLINNCSGALTQAISASDYYIHVGESFFQKYIKYVEEEERYKWEYNDELFLTIYDSENPAINEIVRVNDIDSSGFALYVNRAQEGTQAREWASGTPLAAFITAGVLRKAGEGMFFTENGTISYNKAFQAGGGSDATLNFSAGDPNNTYGTRFLSSYDPEYKDYLNKGFLSSEDQPTDMFMSLYDSVLSFNDLSDIYNYSPSKYIVKNNNYIFRCGNLAGSLYENSVNVGALTVADGACSACFGVRSFAAPKTFNYYGNNIGAFAAGVRAVAVHDRANAIGNEVVAAGKSSTAVGALTAAIGDESTAIGAGILATVDKEFAFSGFSVMTAPATDLGELAFGGVTKNSFEMLLPSRFCDIGTPAAWTADTMMRHGDVVQGSSGKQCVVNNKAFDPRISDNAFNSGAVEPDWGVMWNQDPAGLLFQEHDTGVGMQLHWFLPEHVMLLVTEVGFISHKMGAGVTTAGKISLGDRFSSQPDLVLNNVSIPGTPGERRLHRIPIENPVGLTQPVVTLREIASTGAYVGHFYLRGIVVRTQG